MKNSQLVSNIDNKSILDTLHFKDGTQKLEYKFYLCDEKDCIIDTLEVMEDFTITHNMNATIKRTLEIKIYPTNINLLNKRIKPVVIINNISYPLGIFCIESPCKTIAYAFGTNTIKAYDKTIILQDDCLVENLYLPTGTLVTNGISEIIYSSNIKKVEIEKSNKVLNRDFEFLIGTSKLEIINTLLNYINYTSLSFSNTGSATASPYTLPTNRTVEFTYTTNQISIIKPERELQLNLFNIPNVFIVTSSNSDIASLTSIYINDNPNSIVSTVNRGRNITKKYEVSDIADQGTLDAYVRRLAYNYTTTYEKINFKTSVVPLHSNANCIFVDDKTLGIRDKFIETNWTIKKNEMSHSGRKVVYI